MDVVLPKPGKYVLAVSGGVDSVVLLDILTKQPDLELVVAHFDHGIRPDSSKDKKLVELLAHTHRVGFVYAQASLGAGASEATAREARYKFLRQMLKETRSEAIITAHHQDDLIETAILNMLRGTGRKGLTALNSSEDIIRPMLNVPKAEIIKYAKDHKLTWREDSTNTDDNYLRNYVRHNITPKLTEKTRQQFLDSISNLQKTNRELDNLLKHVLADKIRRAWFSNLPHKVALEVMAAWLRAGGIRDFDKKMLERLVVSAKSGAAGRTFPVMSGYFLEVSKQDLALVKPER